MAKKKNDMPSEPIKEDIVQTDFCDEMSQSFVDYSVSVITDRAIPDVRDGLKPVHRRILYAMHTMGVHNSGPHKKVARIVGTTMGALHAHGLTK
jgi:DNA gyrase subunit A